MLLIITPPTRSRCPQYTVQFPPGRHARPDDGPVTGPKHVVYISPINTTLRYLVVFDYSYPYIILCTQRGCYNLKKHKYYIRASQRSCQVSKIKYQHEQLYGTKNSLLSYMANLTTVNISTETSLVPFLPNSLIIYFNIVVNTASLQAFNLRKGHCALGHLTLRLPD